MRERVYLTVYDGQRAFGIVAKCEVEKWLNE
jgi:hypothetical protein